MHPFRSAYFTPMDAITHGAWEYIRGSGYEILLNEGGYVWKSSDEVSRGQIKRGAFVGGENSQDSSDTIYICRMHFKDGVHPGKYSYKNNFCYIGKSEFHYSKDYEILLYQ